jgi:hypothetical protein
MTNVDKTFFSVIYATIVVISANILKKHPINYAEFYHYYKITPHLDDFMPLSSKDQVGRLCQPNLRHLDFHFSVN